MNIKLKRSTLEQLTDPLIQKTIEPVKKCIKDAGVSASEIDEIILVGGMSRMPLVQSEVKKLFGKDPYKGVNPDEAVALGAAIQGGVLRGDVNELLLLDVTPLSLGIETMGGVFTRLIPRNTTIPSQKSEIFSTAADGQTSVELKVLQGEREMAADNKLLGQFTLDGLPPAPKGTPKIEVKFDIDANGIVNVSARDQVTGKEQSVRIQSSGGLKDDEIDSMLREAEANAEADKQRRAVSEATNQAESVIYDTEKSLKEFDASVSQADKDELAKLIGELREALAKGADADADAIKDGINAVQQKSLKAFEAAYKAQQSSSDSGSSGSSDASGNASSENVKDAEFTEKKDEEKK